MDVTLTHSHGFYSSHQWNAPPHLVYAQPSGITSTWTLKYTVTLQSPPSQAYQHICNIIVSAVLNIQPFLGSWISCLLSITSWHKWHVCCTLQCPASSAGHPGTLRTHSCGANPPSMFCLVLVTLYFPGSTGGSNNMLFGQETHTPPGMCSTWARAPHVVQTVVPRFSSSVAPHTTNGPVYSNPSGAWPPGGGVASFSRGCELIG